MGPHLTHEEVLVAIEAHRNVHGYGPSRAALMRFFDCSAQTINDRCNRLLDRGLLCRGSELGRGPGALYLTERARDAVIGRRAA